jgi:DNA-binding NarL/FixJ family response regulator
MVLDLRMPKCDGVGVLQWVRARHPDAHILILTTCADDEDILKCMSEGAKGYLPKDAPRQEILAAVRTLAANGTFNSPVVGSDLQLSPQPLLTRRQLTVLRLVAHRPGSCKSS